MHYKDAQFERKPGGAVIVDGQEVGHTLQCVHGGEHFLSMRGSGNVRGFCLRCMGPTCGSPEHDICIPAEARLEHMEGKRTKYTGLIVEGECQRQR